LSTAVFKFALSGKQYWVGLSVGDRLGLAVGLAVGFSVGDRLRLAVGLAVGLSVGD
jgi:PIN domain nuclease of toxin-antitoxin system